MISQRILKFGALTAAAALSLTACAGGSTEAGNEAKGELTIAVFNGWDEGIATSELWKAVLEDEGYDVDLQYAEAAPVFQGLAAGDYDFTTDVWLPATHKSYIDEFGDQIEDLGAWNTESKLTVAVNEDAPIDSLDQLAENAELFDNKIVGIESGAGLTQTMESSVIPEYGLEDMKFATSSTSAMLSELKSATDAGENVVVTLWEPHWAYASFPIKNLEDPKGALGGTESIHTYARGGFTEEHSEVAGWLNDFKMDLQTLYSLENLLFVENDTDDYEPLVRQWMEEHPDFVEGMTS